MLRKKHTVNDIVTQLIEEGESYPYIITVLDAVINDYLGGRFTTLQASINSFFTPVQDVRNVFSDRIKRAENRRYIVNNTVHEE
jgi:hypothetical protein